jgi:hypothetical protein
MKSSNWQRGFHYTRRQIHNELGGSIQEFLPHKNGSVVCGCFKPDLDPDAPYEVLPGNGPNIIHWANQFYEQRTAVPIFLKRGTNHWEYAGNWRANGIVTEPTEIAKREQRTGRTDISMILRLVEG